MKTLKVIAFIFKCLFVIFFVLEIITAIYIVTKKDYNVFHDEIFGWDSAAIVYISWISILLCNMVIQICHEWHENISQRSVATN